MHLSTPLIVTFVAAAGLSAHRLAPAQGEFTRTTIDLGVVVSDLEASAAFYTEVIGFTEVEGFSVTGDFCTGAGLTDGEGLTIRVFVLGAGESATKVKLMAVPGVETRSGDNAFIHSHTGFRYLSVFVTDTNAALERLQAGGVAPLGEGPVLIGEDPHGPYLTVVRDPDGNMIELIGPRK